MRKNAVAGVHWRSDISCEVVMTFILVDFLIVLR
jgi:hypothetical protein